VSDLEPTDEVPVEPEPDHGLPELDFEVPEADALDQAHEVEPGERLAVRATPWEADEADVLDQSHELPADDPVD
jgi:hypothetical protein